MRIPGICRVGVKGLVYLISRAIVGLRVVYGMSGRTTVIQNDCNHILDNFNLNASNLGRDLSTGLMLSTRLRDLHVLIKINYEGLIIPRVILKLVGQAYLGNSPDASVIFPNASYVDVALVLHRPLPHCIHPMLLPISSDLFRCSLLPPAHGFHRFVWIFHHFLLLHNLIQDSVVLFNFALARVGGRELAFLGGGFHFWH